MGQLIPNLAKFVSQLRTTIVLPGCGHCTLQERADDVNAAMIEFLRNLWARALVGEQCPPCRLGVTGGKTLSEYIFSELAQIADIVESAGSRKTV